MKDKKNIPNPIIKIGHSVKLNGEISVDIDGNKIKTMKPEVFQEILLQLETVKNKMMKIRTGTEYGDKLLNERQYMEVEDFIKEGRKLAAVKAYKEFTSLGLRESKDAIDALSKRIIK